MSIVAKNYDVLLDSIRELAEYRSEDPVATAFNVGNSFYATNELWRARDPKTAAEIMQHYRESVPGVAQQVFATYGIPAEIMLRGRVRALASPGGGRVLDFGAGIGSQLLPLLAMACRCTHVDVGGVQAEYAAWRYRRLGYHVGSGVPGAACVEMIDLADDYMARGIPELAGRTFDVVICTEVIEHVTDPEGLVAVLSALVKPGGLCVATTSFHDDDGMVPMHLNVDKYDDETFAAEVFPRFGLERIEEFVYRRRA